MLVKSGTQNCLVCTYTTCWCCMAPINYCFNAWISSVLLTCQNISLILNKHWNTTHRRSFLNNLQFSLCRFTWLPAYSANFWPRWHYLNTGDVYGKYIWLLQKWISYTAFSSPREKSWQTCKFQFFACQENADEKPFRVDAVQNSAMECKHIFMTTI